jgi:hypothetical protein
VSYRGRIVLYRDHTVIIIILGAECNVIKS